MSFSRILAGTIVFFVTALSSALAQIELSDNPFPDVIARASVNRPFDLNAPKHTVSGVVTEAPKHIKQPNPYQYFRMAVKDDSATNGVAIWAVLFWAPDADTPALKPGVPVTVLVTPSKDGTRRVALVQQGPQSPTNVDLTQLRIGPQ